MGTQSTRNPVEKHEHEKLSAPPGFESLTTFTLKRIQTTEDPSSPVAIESPHDRETSSSMPASVDLDGGASLKRSLKLGHRPWIVYDQFQRERESDPKQRDMSFPTKGCLPKGVIRGCSECSDCQKVLARWDPEGACTCILEEAPVFHPNKEEFKDTFKYIDSIRQQVEPYGFCRIVPPPSWQLPCFLEESDMWHSFKFSTQIQRVNELQNSWSYGKASAAQDTRETKRRRMAYEIYDGGAANFVSAECHHAERYQSESSPQFTLVSFKRYADFFQQQYFGRDVKVPNAKASPTVHQEEGNPSEQSIEGEYWRIVEKPTEEIEILHGTDLDFSSFGGGSPVSSNPEGGSDSGEKSTSGWDLKYISRLPGSLLSFEKSDSSGIFAPRLHVGMCFSCLPWTIQEHHLYKLYYLHLGAPRLWYGTSGCDSYKYEVVVNKHFRDSSEEHPELCHKWGRQINPTTLKSENIPVYRCIQRPREFVLLLPGAYHSGFDCGFNCSMSAVFAPLDWLPFGLNSTELYREQRRKTSISYDKVLLAAANEAVNTQWECLVKSRRTPKHMMWKEASGKDGILAKVLRARISSESRCREYLSSANQSKKMDKSFDAGDQKKECTMCYYDLYLSAVNCPCTEDKFSCLKHAKDLCSCPWSNKVFWFRYLINELNILLEAVEGKLSAVRSWVKGDLGMPLYWDKCSEGQYGISVSPIAEASSATPAEKEKASEISSGSHKGKEIAVAMVSSSSNLSDDMSSSSSLDLNVEAYIARLRSQRTKKFLPVCNKEGDSAPNRTDKSTKQNASESCVPVPTMNAALEKDKASSAKLHSGAKKPLLGERNTGDLKRNEVNKDMGINLTKLSDDMSLSSSSDSDVEAYIAHIRSLKRSKKMGGTVPNRTEKE